MVHACAVIKVHAFAHACTMIMRIERSSDRGNKRSSDRSAADGRAKVLATTRGGKVAMQSVNGWQTLTLQVQSGRTDDGRTDGRADAQTTDERPD